MTKEEFEARIKEEGLIEVYDGDIKKCILIIIMCIVTVGNG